MPSKLYDEIVSQRGQLENLIAKIPGFKGYHEKNARRQADQQLRRYLADRFQQLVERFTRIESDILGSGAGLKHMSRTREVKSKMQSYVDRVRTAAPKYDGMWASFKIDEDDLDRIYAFDEAQIRFADRFEVGLDKLEEAVGESDDALKEALDNVYDTAVAAIEAFKLRDDVILNLNSEL